MSETSIIIKVGDSTFTKEGDRLHNPGFKNDKKSIKFYNFRKWVWENQLWRIRKTDQDLTELVKAWRAARTGNLPKPNDQIGKKSMPEIAALLGKP